MEAASVCVGVGQFRRLCGSQLILRDGAVFVGRSGFTGRRGSTEKIETLCYVA